MLLLKEDGVMRGLDSDVIQAGEADESIVKRKHYHRNSKGIDKYLKGVHLPNL